METNATSFGPSIRARLLVDHRRLEDLLDRLLVAFEANDREDMASLWAEFEAGLVAHLETEESHLIPSLARTSDRDARALLQEHRHIRARLTELGTAVDLHIIRLHSARNFIDELRAHAQHEDALLYRWADEHIDDEQRVSVLEQLSARILTRLAQRLMPTAHL